MQEQPAKPPEKGCQAWMCLNAGERWVKDSIAERWLWLCGPCFDRQKAASASRERLAPQQPLANQLSMFDFNQAEEV